MTTDISVRLANTELFDDYHVIKNEQLTSKKGRLLNPTPSFSILTLDVHKLYRFGLRFERADEFRYAYVSSHREWQKTMDAHTEELEQVIENEHGEQLGCFWLKNEVAFKVKVSNHKESASSDTVFLNSLRRYQPVLVVSEVKRDELGTYSVVGASKEFRFPGTAFVTVTRYYEAGDIKSGTNKFSSRDQKRKRKLENGGMVQDNNDAKRPLPNGSSNEEGPQLQKQQGQEGTSPFPAQAPLQTHWAINQFNWNMQQVQYYNHPQMQMQIVNVQPQFENMIFPAYYHPF